MRANGWAKWLATSMLALSVSSALAQAPGTAKAPRAPLPSENTTIDEQIESMTNAVGNIDEALAAIDFAGRNADSITRTGFRDLQQLVLLFSDDGSGDDARIGAATQRWVDAFARSGNHAAELTFMGLRTSTLPGEERLGYLRSLHRRAAGLNLVSHPAAHQARGSIAEWARGLLDQARYEEAERALGDTLAEIGDPALRARESRLVRIYAEALAMRGKAVESDAAFAEALAYWQTLDPGDNASSIRDRLRQIQLIQNQTAYYRNLQGRFADAEGPGRIAADMAVDLLGRESIATQKARYNYAVALLGQGNAADALPYFEEALPLQRQEEDNAFAIWAQRDTAILLTTLARARSQVSGREADGLAAAIEAAAIVRSRREHRSGGGNDNAAPDAGAVALARAVARSDRRDPLAGAFDMVMLAGWAARTSEPAALESAFAAAQDLTLSEAGDAITQAAARDLAGDGALGALVRERQDTAARIVTATASYRDAQLGSNAERVAALRTELGTLGDRLATLDFRLGRDFPAYSDLVTPRAVGTRAIHDALGANEAFVMLLPSEGHHYVFAITRESVEWHRADEGAASVAALVSRIRCRLDEATCSPAESIEALRDEEQGEPTPIDDYYPRFDRAAAWRLYALLIAPLAPALEGKSTVYVVASGPVSALPLAALVTEDPGDAPVANTSQDLLRTRWLGDRHAFVTLPSAAALTLPRERDNATSGTGNMLVGYGAPLLDGNAAMAADGATRGARRRGGSQLRAAAFFKEAGAGAELKVDPAKLRTLDPLPGTARELERLASALGSGDGADTTLHIGAAATETAVKRDTAIGDAEVVVFATHGLLPGEMGLAAEPGLVMTPPQGSGTADDDGLLTASEAAALDLDARWVILSACNTATADGGGSDALSGLARSFLYAGADSLLASHWRVADDASAALTVQTIRADNAGSSQAGALRAAQRAVRTGYDAQGSWIQEWQPHWAHPAAWAPFTLITDHDR